MKTVSGALKKAFTFTNILSGICFFSVMVLVLLNIIMRNVFKSPITGTVEIVGLLVATGLGLAMANCEMLGGNIGMDISLPWPRKVDKIIEIVSYVISLSFWAIVVWRIFVYASTSFTNGRVTSTASIPVYPFIFILCFSVFCLCVALAYKLVCMIMDVSGLRETEREEKEESK